MATDNTNLGLRHEALLYAGPDAFVERTLPFIEEGLAKDEPILVVVSADKIGRLRGALNGSANSVLFADMTAVGANPARIIPAWSDFLATHQRPGRAVRGIGEPIWAERSEAELVECQLHESLLNLAFAGSGAFTLLCPYDTTTLRQGVIDEALHSHPSSLVEGTRHESRTYRRDPWRGGPFDNALPEPPSAAELSFEGMTDLRRLRAIVGEYAVSHGLSPSRAAELVLVVHEAAANSIRHGGGNCNLRIWADAESVICELRDKGQIDQPLIGRTRPSARAEDGRGVWLIQQLADLAQIRSDDNGTTVRIHFSIPS